MNWILSLALVAIVNPLPIQSPEIIWSELNLEQQMAIIELWRPDPPPVRVVEKPAQTLAPVGEPWFQPLIKRYFKPADYQWAARVSLCESGWRADAKNKTSTASGLFQVLEGWWSGEWSAWPAFDPFDAESNVEFAAWLYYTGGPQHWVCK